MTTLEPTHPSPSVQDEALFDLPYLPASPLHFERTMPDRAPTSSRLSAQDTTPAIDQQDLAARFAALQLKFEEAEARLEEERRGRARDQARLEAERAKTLELEEKQRESKKEQEKLSEAQRNTTFEELLELCHTNFAVPLEIEKSAKSTKGTTTAVEDKFRPSQLQSWNDFPDQRHVLFVKAQQVFAQNAPIERFPSRSEIRGHGMFLGMNLSSEGDLERYHDGAVERAVRVIVEKLCGFSEAQQDFNMGHGFVFESNTNRLNDNDREVRDRKPNLNADRYGIAYRKTETGEKGEVIFMLEYKPAHKMTLQILREGVKDMELDDVVNNPRKFTDPEKCFTQQAEEFVAKVATQIYDYMLKSGIEYGCIVTGEALVFVRLDILSSAQSLYYHLAEPMYEYDNADSTGAPAVSLTAVAQLLSFTLMAFGATNHSQEARAQALRDAKIWTKDEAKLLRKMSDPQIMPSPPSSAYKGKSYRITTSPRVTRSKSRQTEEHGSCKGGGEETRQDSDSSSEDEGPHRSPSRKQWQPGSRSQHSLASRPKHRSSSTMQHEKHDKQNTRGTAHDFDYCTESCLLGLIENRPLDPDCPNCQSHRGHSKSNVHPISIASALHLIKKQLQQDLDNYCIDLKRQGARGMLFKIVLMPFSYCFVGKGTRDVFVPDLRHEGRMYQRMRALQARHIPVHLGNIDMSRPWYGLGFEIIHMLFLSFAGSHYPNLDEKWSREQEAAWSKGPHDFVAEITRLGIQHNDLDERNILYHAKLGCSRVIDFERSCSIKQDTSPKHHNKQQVMEIFEDHQEHAAEAQAPPPRAKDRPVLEAIPLNTTLTASAQLDVVAKSIIVDSVNPLKSIAHTANSIKTMDRGQLVETSDRRR